MSRLGSGGSDVISRCLRSRLRSRDDHDESFTVRVTTSPYGSVPSDYRLLRRIGSGSFGLVYLAQHRPSSSTVVVRETPLDQANGSEVVTLSREVRLCRLLRHPNVVRYHSVYVKDDALCTVTDLMTHRSARDLLVTFPSGLPELVIRSILRPVIGAVDYLHARHGLIHRSLAAHHILVGLSPSSQDPRVKITGFQYSISAIKDGLQMRRIHEFPPHSASILYWLAPEVLQQNVLGYNSKSDVYSLGVTACELANGEIPFARMATTQVLYNKLREDGRPFPFDCDHLPDDDSSLDAPPHCGHNGAPRLPDLWLQRRFSFSFHDFVSLCLEPDQINRPSATTLSSHSFVKLSKKSSSPDPLYCLLKSLPSVLDIGTDIHPSVSKPSQNQKAPIVRSESDLSSAWDFD